MLVDVIGVLCDAVCLVVCFVCIVYDAVDKFIYVIVVSEYVFY